MARISLDKAKSGLDRIISGLAPPKKFVLDEKALRRAGIGVLIHDERWERLFSTIKKPQAIIKAEGAITSLIDEKTRLNIEKNMSQAEKQSKIYRIKELTDQVFNIHNTAVRIELDECDARIKEINERAPQIVRRIDEIDAEIRSENLALLEMGISYLYQYMKKSQAKVAELDKQITETRELLKTYISERETLEGSANETYHFLHGLLGAQQIESLDEHYTL